MKLYSFIIGLLLASIVSAQESKYQIITLTDSHGYKYQTVTNDPLALRIYTLKNGLRIYLSVNKDAPRIQSYIAVKTGSVNDPENNTGLAHYFEHMMFKGTSKIGTLNWEKEKPLLDQIANLFDKRRDIASQKSKDSIYHLIDSLSTLASQYVVPNEYDKMISALGAQNTNAYTSKEETVYMNNIPANELRRYLLLEKERFANIALRLFHTELEAVYEEFNMSQDNDDRRVYNTLYKALFPVHPYGRPTIGLPEHIKNPSMTAIMNFWKKYYVPNNIAICMSGDLNPDSTVVMVDSIWGALKPSYQKPVSAILEKDIAAPVIKDVYSPSPAYLMMAYRTSGANSPDKIYLTLIDILLSSGGKAGLIDLNLIKSQKVLSAGCEIDQLRDMGYQCFFAYPKEGQSLEEAKDLLLAEVEKIKKGQFDDWMLQAAINDLKLHRVKAEETNSITSKYVESFIQGSQWLDYVSEFEKLSRVTKADLVTFANEFYKDNYVVINKRTGVDSSIVKVEKPSITPININRNDMSEYCKAFMETPTGSIAPQFIDYKTAFSKQTLRPNIELAYIKNTTNDLFSLSYIVDLGTYHNKMLPLAVNFISFLGTTKFSNADWNKELYRQGLEFAVRNDNHRTYFTISGLDGSFAKGVELLEHVIANLKPDTAAWRQYVDGIIKLRNDAKIDKDAILQGLISYGKYGKNSPLRNIYTEQELRAMQPAQLTSFVKDLLQYKHTVFYYGKKSLVDVNKQLTLFHKQTVSKTVPAEASYRYAQYDSSKIFFVDFDMVQTNVLFASPDCTFNKDLISYATMYNEYFGSGLSSIVFQELREARALAYHASAAYRSASRADDNNFTSFYINTSPAKLDSAIIAMQGLMKEMPYAEQQFSGARHSIISSINSQRIVKSNIFWTWLQNRDRGLDYDVRRDTYNSLQTLTFEQLKDFFAQHVSSKQYFMLVMGNKKNINLNDMAKYGNLTELSLEDIFGY